MRKEEKIKFLVKLFATLFFISFLTVLNCGEKADRPEAGEMSLAKGKTSGAEVKIPWDDYGYGN